MPEDWIDLYGEVAVRSAEHIAQDGFTQLDGSLLGSSLDEVALDKFAATWDDLPFDTELVDGGRYRRRRYGRLRARIGPAEQLDLTVLPHGAFQQDAEHIPIYHGRARVFEPITEEVLTGDVLRGLIEFDLSVARHLTRLDDWEVGLHQIRIMAQPDSIGLPTPEGRHRDGHFYVGMHMLRRDNCLGGESIIAHGSAPERRFTLLSRLDTVIIDDQVVTHEVTPIHVTHAEPAIRDMLLVDLNPYRE